MTSAQDLEAYRQFIRERAQSKEYADFMKDLTCRLVEIENTPTQPLDQIARNEKQVFDLIEEALRAFADGRIAIERQPINPGIAHHPYFSRLYYTADERHPEGRDVETTYKDRCNMLVLVDAGQSKSQGRPAILNAHIDTVAPFLPCRLDGQQIHGRGTVDDKGLVVMLVASLKLLKEAEAKFGPVIGQPLVYQFVIEEETGGNGSLSASLDERFRGYEAIICEATELRPHPANRGAMWFKLDFTSKGSGFDTAEILPFILVELATEGQKLRQESNEPLFPRDYVQVNLGALDHFGKHPATINDYVAFELGLDYKGPEGERVASRLINIIEAGVKQYCVQYPDRTAEVDPETGKPKLNAHYKLTTMDRGNHDRRYKLEVFGLGGHMSTLTLRDNAMIKAGYLLKGLVCSYKNLPGLALRVRVLDDADGDRCTITGGVGFTPAHRMAALQDRLKGAVAQGFQLFNRCAQGSVAADSFAMTFDMLHNEAYVSPVDCPAMKAFKWAFDAREMPWPTPLAFRASCDARIFGNNGHNTVTFGPGQLSQAHGDHEKISLQELQAGLEVVTLATLALTTGQ